jgi:hypothetical protein|tara:strand:- start:13440 stop:13550 length:111 start_codon:yes stop_codon:yes gene_type:complete
MQFRDKGVLIEMVFCTGVFNCVKGCDETANTEHFVA